jgi:predicted phosphodiesterase
MIVKDGIRLPRLLAGGLLLVGDPEIASRRPGRRRDPDWPNAILRKLEAIVAHANEHRLLVVFLGDFYEHAKETDESLKTRVTRILKGLWTTPLANVGNHDMTNTRLGDGDSLAYLAVSDTIHAVAESGPVTEVEIDGKVIGIGMTPYWQEIPRDVTGLFPEAVRTFWFTHHDIALQENYPGAVKPFEIVGCAAVANGHIHTHKKAEKVGKTLWHNPGSINRSTADLVGQLPRAWVMKADGIRLAPVDLPHGDDVFDMTGRLVEVASVGAVAKSVDSVFVSMLKAETSGEVAQSGDGAVIAEELKAIFAERETAEDVRSIVLSLLEEATDRHAA